MNKVILYLKVWGILNHYFWNYGPSKLLFCFIESYIGKNHKTQMKQVEMLEIHISKSYNKTQTLVKIWSSSGLSSSDICFN